jgi:hypothetical protein
MHVTKQLPKTHITHTPTPPKEKDASCIISCSKWEGWLLWLAAGGMRRMAAGEAQDSWSRTGDLLQEPLQFSGTTVVLLWYWY